MNRYEFHRARRALAVLRPGERVYVPRRLPRRHWIVQALGPHQARLLAAAYGGLRIDLPSQRSARALKQAIMRARGSYNEIAARFGVTYGYVAQLKRRAAHPPPAPLLELIDTDKTGAGRP